MYASTKRYHELNNKDVLCFGIKKFVLQNERVITLIRKKGMKINPIEGIDICVYNLNIGMLMNAIYETCSHKLNKKQTATAELE